MGLLEKFQIYYIYQFMKIKVAAIETRALKEYQEARQSDQLVQPPIKSTRIFSPAILAQSFSFVKTFAFQRHMREGLICDDARVEESDVIEGLRHFYLMQGVDGLTFDRQFEDHNLDPYYQSQLLSLKTFRQAYQDVVSELRAADVRAYVPMVTTLVQLGHAGPDKKPTVLHTMKVQLERLYSKADNINHLAEANADQIAALKAIRLFYQDPETQDLLKP